FLTLAQEAAQAGDCCSPTYRLGFSVGLAFKGWAGCDCGSCGHGCGSGCGGCGAAPWYQYWPYNAHFQTPAPTGYPYWPAPMTAMGYGAAPMGPGAGPATYYGAAPMPPSPVQPAAYYPQAPAYWYGN